MDASTLSKLYDGRHVDGSGEVIAADVVQVLSDTLAADTTELLEKFSEERGQDDRAADGIAATVEALRMSQLGTLILADIRDTGRTAWFGPEPTHLALHEPELRNLGVGKPTEASLEEILVRAALGTGAEITCVFGGVEQAPTEGVGGLLRYPG